MLLFLTEIRLKIYAYLFVAHPSQLKRAVPNLRASKEVVLKIGHRYTARVSKWTGGNSEADASIGLTPQILRACKAIYQEAIQILYRENLFSFSIACRHEQDKLESFCRELYLNPAGYLERCPFAMFLRQIGQKNAASLRRLRFVGGGSWHFDYSSTMFWAFQEITRLLKHRAPGVCQVKICRDVTYREELEDGSFELNKGSEFSIGWTKMWGSEDGGEDGHRPHAMIRRREQEAMYKAIEEMVEEITWLKDLTVTGFEKKDPARPKIENLQAMVKSRR